MLTTHFGAIHFSSEETPSVRSHCLKDQQNERASYFFFILIWEKGNSLKIPRQLAIGRKR